MILYYLPLESSIPMLLLILQIILGIVYYLGLPALAGVPAIFFFLPIAVWTVVFLLHGLFLLVVGILLTK